MSGTLETKNNYFPTVDFLRGLGALVILVWHYHHFYFTQPYFSPETGSPVWDFSAQPFYFILWPFYHYGSWGVQFFWALSGFVFAHVYSTRRTDAKTFFIFRFSRLYPLHVITLLAITALQYTSLHLFDKFQILAINDAYHFMLHLFFASNWGFEKGFSFNSPVWSISVEEIAYWFFWIIAARKGNLTFKKSLLLTVVALIASDKTGYIGQCIFYFMSGSTAFLAFKERDTLKKKVILSFATSLFAAIMLYHSLSDLGMSAAFCSIVLVAASLDASGLLKKFDEKFLFVGSLTYSTYMLHLPIQVLILIIFEWLKVDRSFFNQGTVLIGFIFLMILVGRLSFIYIERPIQVKIRNSYRSNIGRPKEEAYPITVAEKSKN